MKLRLLLIFVSTISAYYINAQENSKSKLVRTENNGIQVYESHGNEIGISNYNALETDNKRTISDWNIEECDNALYFIRIKIESLKEETNSALEIERLKDYENQVISHKSYLLSKN